MSAVRARKRFAQHFLEAAWVNKLVAAVGAGPEDSILEIGPGRGAITRPLALQAGRLLAIEVDRDLAADLEMAALPNVTVITSDVLNVDLIPAL
ncbi:MAG TPA: rRNA adenine N-6-methyltransferase family protein, partial [Vicinamibacterales bacterium]